MNEVLLFRAGLTSITHTVRILQDITCEIVDGEDTEGFRSSIINADGDGTVRYPNPDAVVLIEDIKEEECGT